MASKERVPESPLVQVEKGELKPKVLSIYEELFQPDKSGELGKSEGYWTEFFLLRCHQPALFHTLDGLTAEQTIAAKTVTRQLFKRGVGYLKDSGYDKENTLCILSVFLRCIFAKPFVSYSSDLINVLAGLNEVDTVFKDLVDGLDNAICKGETLSMRVSAIRTTTIAAGGTYNTSLATYFTHNNSKDMFGSIIAFINSEGTELYVGDAFSLLGILSGFDKLESPHNPYQTRLADFIDDNSMRRIVHASGHVWKICLDQYLANPAPTPTPTNNPSPSSSTQSLGASLAYWIGLRSAQNSPAANGSVFPEVDEDKTPPHQTFSIVLGFYEFISVNKLFARVFVQSSATGNTDADTDGTKLASSSDTPPFVLFLNLCSWLVQNQHKTHRARVYSRLLLIILRLLIEESCQTLVNEDNKTTALAICQHRNPPLPKYGKEPHALLEGVLDVLQCCVRYNMRAKSMDYEMYTLALTNIYQIIAHLRTHKIRQSYHWHELWKSLLSLTKFINTHPSSDPNCLETSRLIGLIFACCLIHGDDTILPDDKQYHDLIYKLIVSAEDVQKLTSQSPDSPSTHVIMAAVNHYKSLLENSNKSSSLISSNQVSQTIKNGYQTISLQQYATSRDEQAKQTTSYLLHENLPKFKESTERLFFKNLTRQVIHDVNQLYK
ncbi:hypothetical protein TRICI_004267 [Trichomonascus ciferrii]|uniref:Armadillo-like helical domain-containing protein n=1 Tax=Trichomonascus ciferrii TaxID=44093 RepID=A0A642V1F7_9ASCO|nr:hypothetical protein TRICI_004267 [Trichomonascus ciferrii]